MKRGTSLICRFSRAAGATERELQAQAGRRPPHPRFWAQRPTPLHTRSDSFQLLVAQLAIDPRNPIPRPRYGPRAQWQFGRAMCPSPESTPLPILSPLDQFGTLGIRFYVAAQGQKVVVLGYGKTLESALVNVPAAAGVVMFVVATDMHHPHPAHPAAQGVVGLGPNNQVPMIGHQTVREQLHRVSLQAVGQYPLERLKVFRFAKNRDPAVPTVQHVVHHTCFGRSGGSRHHAILAFLGWPVNICDVPFYSPILPPAVPGENPHGRQERRAAEGK